MSITTKIRLLSPTERVYTADGVGDHGEHEYTLFVDAVELIALAKSHERLLKVLRSQPSEYAMAEVGDAWWASKELAIKEAEKI